MLREILTLNINDHPHKYYISFTPHLDEFRFEPTLSNEHAPRFTVFLKNGAWTSQPQLDKPLWEEVLRQIKELLTNGMYDNLNEPTH